MSAEPRYRVYGSEAHLLVFLDGRLAPCGMSCTFCSPAFKPWETRAVEAGPAVDDVVASLSAELRARRPARLDLVSDDILAFPRLPELLAVTAELGTQVRLVTAGLRLADPVLAGAVKASGARVVLTLLSRDPARYAAIAGRPDAHAAVHAAIAEVRRQGLPLDLGIVVVDRNVHELADLVREARDLGSDPVAIRVFHPDARASEASHYAQYPRFEDVLAGLRALAASGEPLPRLELSNLPWCALDPTGLDALDVIVPNTPNELSWYAAPGCTGCPARPRCSGLHPAYADQHGGWPTGAARVADALAWSDAKDAARRRPRSAHVEPEDTAPLLRERVFEGEPVELGVGQRLEGFAYFFETPTHGCYYRGSFRDPAHAERFRAALRGAMRRLRAVDAAALDGDALVAAMRDVLTEARAPAGPAAPPAAG